MGGRFIRMMRRGEWTIAEAQAKRGRGRPRAYDPDAVLGQALETFWAAGYFGTSVDELSLAMGLSRPSLYAGFGDKRTLYLRAIELYCLTERAAVERAISEARPLRQGLRVLVRNAVDNYVAGAFGPRGCFMASVAVTDAASDPIVRRALEASVRDLEARLTQRFRRAQETGELLLAAPPELLAHMACNTLYGLALRARAGVPRQELERSAAAAMGLLCGRLTETAPSGGASA
jgi:AcrR family transcriptional regulator